MIKRLYFFICQVTKDNRMNEENQDRKRYNCWRHTGALSSAFLSRISLPSFWLMASSLAFWYLTGRHNIDVGHRINAIVETRLKNLSIVEIKLVILPSTSLWTMCWSICIVLLWRDTELQMTVYRNGGPQEYCELATINVHIINQTSLLKMTTENFY